MGKLLCKSTLIVTRCEGLGVRVLQFNATFNNISVISWWSVSLVEGPGENHRPVTLSQCCIEHTSTERDSNSPTLMVLGTDYISSFKPNYHTITTTMAP